MDKELPKKSIIFITKGDVKFPSSRFRVYQYARCFEADGFEFHMEKVKRGTFKRLYRFFQLRKYDILFIQKKFLRKYELIILKRLFNTIVYDFDDAMGVKSSFKEENPRKLRRTSARLLTMCRYADVVICGNSYLKELSGRPDALLLPTPYSTPGNVPDKDFDSFKILWIGLDMTKLMLWKDALVKLQNRYPFSITICSNKEKPPVLPFKYEYRRWSPKVERELFDECNIGIMPIPDDENSRGKCGFKIIQYMAHNLIALAGDVGFNREIISDRVDGFLCSDDNHFYQAMSEILEGKHNFEAILQAGQEKSKRFNTKTIYRELKQHLGSG